MLGASSSVLVLEVWTRTKGPLPGNKPVLGKNMAIFLTTDNNIVGPKATEDTKATKGVPLSQ